MERRAVHLSLLLSVAVLPLVGDHLPLLLFFRFLYFLTGLAVVVVVVVVSSTGLGIWRM